MQLYDRYTQTYRDEQEYSHQTLSFLYNNPLGRLLLKLVVLPVFSRVYAHVKSRPASARQIPSFVETYGIRMEDFEEKSYRSFSDFFTRRFRPGARAIDSNPEALIAPADARLLVYNNGSNSSFYVKGHFYTLDELTGGRVDTRAFRDACVLVFRLAVEDCHRYCFVDSGHLIQSASIAAQLHSVRSISEAYPVFRLNSRVVSLLETQNFGPMLVIEVGALSVGRIVNHESSSFVRGEEKGYFELGGSTIIIVVQAATVCIDNDIVEMSRKGIETKVLLGERIGKRPSTC